MKKYMSLLLALVLVLSLAACGGKDEPAQTPDAQEEVQTSPEVQPEAGDAEETPDEAPVIDYDTTPFEEWIYAAEDEEGPQALLTAINGVPYGSAGSSLKELVAATAMVELSRDPDALQAVQDFLEAMTPIQQDYFTFSWEMIADTASNLFISFEQMEPGLLDAGIENFDISQYSQEDFQAVDEAVRDLFTQENIPMEWQNHLDIAPFLSADR